MKTLIVKIKMKRHMEHTSLTICIILYHHFVLFPKAKILTLFSFHRNQELLSLEHVCVEQVPQQKLIRKGKLTEAYFRLT
jgi:hypothetical protein